MTRKYSKTTIRHNVFEISMSFLQMHERAETLHHIFSHAISNTGRLADEQIERLDEELQNIRELCIGIERAAINIKSKRLNRAEQSQTTKEETDND